MISLEELRYPVGKLNLPDPSDAKQLKEHIEIIAAFPARLRQESAHLDNEQLDTPYRENGWTIRQVVHHVADSHVNSYCRFKLALTEENPTIRPYFEDRWAELQESKTAPVSYSLQLVDAIHARWVLCLNNMSEADYDRTFFHPEMKRSMTLYQALCMYSWHCRHHLAHITELKKRKSWD